MPCGCGEDLPIWNCARPSVLKAFAVALASRWPGYLEIFPAIRSSGILDEGDDAEDAFPVLRTTSLAPRSILKRGIVNSTNHAP